jgi:ATP-binding cassette subfamily B protein
VAKSSQNKTLISFSLKFCARQYCSLAALYVGKLIIDQVVALNASSPAGNLQNYGNWLP